MVVVGVTLSMSHCWHAAAYQDAGGNSLLAFPPPSKRALDIMDVMLERDVEPNIVTYGAAISACARGGTYCFFLFLFSFF